METAESVQERVGRRIAELRVLAGLDYPKASELLGMPVSNIQRIEQGQQNLTIKMLVRIAKALRVTVAQLFDEPSAPLSRAKRGRPKRTAT